MTPPAGAGAQRQRPGASVGARFAWTGALLLTLVVTALLGRALFADLYAEHGQSRRRAAPTGAVALEATRIATRLAPWQAQAWRAYAQSLASRGEHSSALEPLREALRRAPADASLWLDLARALARDGNFGAPLEHAVATAQRLAPNSPSVQLALAMEGAQFWRHASAPMQELWLASMRFALRRNARQFLLFVAAAQREEYVCGYVGAELDLARWCEFARGSRGFCAQPGLTRGQQRKCWKHGFLPRQRP